MKKAITALLFFCAAASPGQSSSDSVSVTFRYYSPASPTVHVPGEFNSWQNLAEVSRMEYDSVLDCWVKTLTFKIKDPSDARRTQGDSVWQYTFFPEGTAGPWPSDPLNPEKNPTDNNNAVLRLSRLRWFEVYARDSGSYLTRIEASVIHANSDSITSVKFEGSSVSQGRITLDVTDSLNRSLRVLSFSLSDSVYADSSYRLVAKNQLGDSTVHKHVVYKIVKAALPAYAKRGVTLPDSGAGRDSTTFRLQIPDTNIVLLRIAPTGESLAAVEPVAMKQNFSSLDWWVNIMLTPGTYEYLYELSDGRGIYDPWGRQNGTMGTRFTVGPEGLAADNYGWSSTPYQRPPANKLVLYELHLREFTALGPSQGKFTDLIPLLAHFNDLGVNAIELMPINDYGNIGPSNSFSWGYDPNHHFAPEPSYGTPAEFKELVDSAHARGIAVVLDIVFNHLNDPAPLWQMVPDEAKNPYFKFPPPVDTRSNEDGLVFFKDMDLWTPEARQYIIDVLKMWIDEYRVDGFRYDYTQGIGWSMNDTTGGILGFTRRIDSEYGGSVIQIAEHLPESPALIRHGKLTGGWHDSFRDKIFDDARFQNVSLTDFENLVLGLGASKGNDVPDTPYVYADRTQPINHTVNHDEQSLVYEMINFQNVDTLDALSRDKTYAAMMFTSLGIPMLWQGMEWGEARGWDGMDGGVRMSYRPVRLDLKSTERGKDQFRWYKTLAYQRRLNPALFDGRLRTLWRYDAQRTLVWGLEDTVTSSQVMVLANLSGSDQYVTNVPWLSAGTWYEIVSQSPFVVSADTIPVVGIPRYSAIVYANRTNEQLNIPVSVDSETGQNTPSSFSVSMNYPNPLNPSTSLRYDLPRQSNVRIEVFNMIGEVVSVILDSRVSAGSYTVRWDGMTSSGIPASSGMYIVRFSMDNSIETRKILLIR